MRKIYIGFSCSITSEELISYFDFDPAYPQFGSKFERLFASDYVEPGAFEVYGKSEYPDEAFNASLLNDLFPFTPDPQIMKKIDFETVVSVFFVNVQNINMFVSDQISLIGSMEIEQYDFEIEKPNVILL